MSRQLKGEGEVLKAYHCIILGGGLAAFQLARNLKPNKRVLLITKGQQENNNSYRAQGGIAAAVGEDDHPNLHFEDTIQAGCDFHNEVEVRALVENGPATIWKLDQQGFLFDRTIDGNYSLGMEGAHSRSRIVHCGGDATGKQIMTKIQKTIGENVDVVENQFVYELIICQKNKRCIGIQAKDEMGRNHLYRANEVIIATGGIGGLYKYTSNDPTITGDGIALAYRAGAEIVDMEFVQFHPTLLYVEGETKGLISEAVRGAGAKLVNCQGELIMKNRHPLGDLAPRHIVAKEIYEQRLAGYEVFLDISMIPCFPQQFPTISKLCEEHCDLIEKERLPVAPGAHFLMGGILVNTVGETSIKGLYAVGEVAATGVHGANRLASNSLLEGLYYGQKIAQHLNGIEKSIPNAADHSVDWADQEKLQLPTQEALQEKVMKGVGIIRTQSELLQIEEWCHQFEEVDGTLKAYEIAEIQLIFMLQVVKLIASAALLRTESRGAHQRADFLTACEEWQKVHLVQSKNGIEKRKLYEQYQTEIHA